MKTITLNNGVEMPMQGFGVFQIAPRDCETTVLLHDSIKYPPIDNRNDPPRLSKEVLSHAKKKEDHGLRCVQQWRIKNHDQTRRKSEDPAPGTR